MKDIKINGKDYYLKFEAKEKYWQIDAYNEKDENIGYVNMLKNSRGLWLNKIFVEEQERFQGVGQALLNAFEAFIERFGYTYVEGKFYPENTYAREFYEKNGYTIDKDGYETYVSKDFYKKKCKDERTDKDSLFEDSK